VKLPDVNVLVGAVNDDGDEHKVARSWLESALAAPAGVGFAWVALLGFVRVTTQRAILPRPLGVEEALATVHDWLAAPRARILHPTERHEDVFASLLRDVGTAGNLTSDAHLAALAIEHGATLASFDRDFLRFESLSFERLRAKG
jgi:uncharacterized protein